MAFTPIQDSDFNGYGARSLPDQPTISSEALKAKFDEPARTVMREGVNRLITELQDSTAAANMGATAPTGRTVANPTVQADINKLSTDLATVEGQMSTVVAEAHTHDNKTVLDKFSDDGTGIKYNGASIEGAVKSVNSKTGDVTLTATDVGALPDSTTIPSKTSELVNDSNFVDTTALNNGLAGKVDKEVGKGLSTNDYDNTAKGIVDGATAAIAAKSTVTYQQTYSQAGQKLGTITIDGTPTDIIAPTGGGGGGGGAVDSVNNQTGQVELDLGDMMDASFSGLAENDAVVRNGSGEWTNIPLPLSALTGSYADLKNKPTKVSDFTNDAGYQTASDVSTAISGKADTSSLKDLAYIDKDGVGSTKVLQGDGTWVTPSTGGHNMLDNSTIISGINSSISEGTSNDDVVSAYGVGIWSNVDGIKILSPQLSTGTDTVGTWEDDATWETGSRVGWIWHSALYNILGDNDYDIEPIFVLVSGKQTAISCLSYRIDDNVSNGGVNGGAFAIKLNAPIPAEQNNVKVGLLIKHNRTNTFNGTAISS